MTKTWQLSGLSFERKNLKYEFVWIEDFDANLSGLCTVALGIFAKWIETSY